MVGPERKREAVAMSQRRLEVSERRACKTLGQSRATQRYEKRRAEADRPLIKAMCEKARQHPRFGYRRVGALLRREGWQANARRLHRLWRQEGLKVPVRPVKRRRLGHEGNGSPRQRAGRVNEVWSYDFVFDVSEDGRPLKWLPLIDEYSKELLALEVERRIDSRYLISLLDRLVRQRGAPDYIRSDNGPEFAATAVKEWIAEQGFQTLFIEPGAPWQNAYSESFNGRLRDELLNLESFSHLLEAKVLAKDYRQQYNQHRPHSALDYHTPAEFAERCFASLRATPSASQNIAQPRKNPTPLS